MGNDTKVWVYSPGNLLGVGLLTAAASVNATGVIDLNDTSPNQWGNLKYNLKKLRAYYPKTSPLGFRVAVNNLQSLVSYPEFPDQSLFFFILTAISDPSELKVIKLFPQINFYVEIHSVAVLRLMESYCRKEAISLAGYVAVTSESGGRTGNLPAFILSQEIKNLSILPIYIRGGFGVHTAGVLPLANIAGLVLDDQVLLFPGSPIGKANKEIIERLDGREFEILENNVGETFRIIRQPWAMAAQQFINEYKNIISRKNKIKKTEAFFVRLKEALLTIMQNK